MIFPFGRIFALFIFCLSLLSGVAMCFPIGSEVCFHFLQELCSERGGWGVSHLFRGFYPATKGFGSHRVGQSPISARLGVPGRAGSGSTEPGRSQGRPLAAFFPGSALLPSSPALSVSCPALPCPPGMVFNRPESRFSGGQGWHGQVCSISTPAWCEELPRCPAPAELVGQKVPFSAGPVACAHTASSLS